jgi:hypothetical protein
MNCKCCDNPLRPEEIIWIPERKTHEELCRTCRKAVQESLLDSEIAGPKTTLNHVTDEIDCDSEEYQE